MTAGETDISSWPPASRSAFAAMLTRHTDSDRAAIRACRRRVVRRIDQASVPQVKELGVAQITLRQAELHATEAHIRAREAKIAKLDALIHACQARSLPPTTTPSGPRHRRTQT